MRIQPWMTAVAGAVMLLAAHSPTSAQTPMPGASYPNGNWTGPPPGVDPYTLSPGQRTYQTPPSAPGGPADPNTLYPPGTPPNYQPWPTISPFHAANVGQDQISNRDGLWFRELFYRRREKFISVEPMAVFFRDAGNSLIGSAFVEQLVQTDGQNVFGGIQNYLDGPFVDSVNVTPNPTGVFVVDPRIVPFPALSTTAGTYNDSADRDLFPIRKAGVLNTPPTVPGLQLRTGFMNEDYTGVMANAWYGWEARSDFSRGFEFINGVRVNQTLTTQLDGQNLTTLNGNIPLQNGESLIPFVGPGATAKYDILYSLKFTTEAGGGNLSFYQQPLYRNGGVMVRPLWGARYLYLNEGFRFRGIDSGFNYQVDEDTHRASTGSLELLYNQYTASLANDVRSHIAGPEVGLRYDLGDNEGFKVWGESIFGITANNENIHLRGDNIGDPLVDTRFNGFVIPRILDDANFDSEFNKTRNSTHVSPLFQQSLFAEFAFLDTIPIIRDISLFDDAKFRLGYTLTVVGGVARPIDSVQWNGFPLSPEIKNNRDTWWMQTFNLAIDWHF